MSPSPALVLGVLLFNVPVLAQVQSDARRSLLNGSAASGEVVVKLEPGASIDEVLSGFPGILVSNMGSDTYLVDVRDGTEWMASEALGLVPGTMWAEPNRLLFPPETPGCGASQHTSGQQCTIAIFDGDPAPERYYEQPTVPIINVEEALAVSAGLPSLVAVIDTGIDPDHSVFAGRLHSLGYDFILDLPGALDLENAVDDDMDGLVDEAVGHGTHVSGIVSLINPAATILPLKVLDSDGNGSAFNVARAIRYAVSSGADVINLSLGMVGYSRAVEDALELAEEAGVRVFAAAGNHGTGTVLFPASDSRTTGVAALDELDVKAPFSGFGEDVDLCAPGMDIYSAMPGEAWAWWSGTSMATAVASGAASLLHSVVGFEEELEVDEVLQESSVDIEPLNPGYDEHLGDGRIDVEAGALLLISGSGSSG